MYDTKPRCLTLAEYCDEQGYADADDLMDRGAHDLLDSVVVSLCEDACEVEGDARCEHGHPSPLIVLGLI